MAKKTMASWKEKEEKKKEKDRMIKRGDNVMVGGRPTDIVIPCDSIHFLSTVTYQFQCYGPNRSRKKHCMLMI